MVETKADAPLSSTLSCRSCQFKTISHGLTPATFLLTLPQSYTLVNLPCDLDRHYTRRVLTTLLDTPWTTLYTPGTRHTAHAPLATSTSTSTPTLLTLSCSELTFGLQYDSLSAAASRQRTHRVSKCFSKSQLLIHERPFIYPTSKSIDTI